MKIDIKKSLDSALSDVDWHGENEVLSRIRPKARAPRLRLAFVACLLALAIGGTALAVGLHWTERYSDIRRAREAVAAKYGLTSDMLDLFYEKVSEDGQSVVLSYMAGDDHGRAGYYTFNTADGSVVWSHDGAEIDESGALDAAVWGKAQLQTRFEHGGAGTDPTEGAALAMSILEALRVKNVRTLATTHYSELKAYALSTKGVENASVEFNVETLRPTYRLSIGVPGKSNAFEISRKLGLPEEIIAAAGEKLTRDQVRFEDVIANAEYHRQIAEKERALAEEAHRETQRLRDEADKMRRDIDAQRADMLKKAKDDARKVLLKAQRESEQLISELKRAKAKDGAALKEHELNEIRNKLQGSIDDMNDAMRMKLDSNVLPPENLRPGETVELPALGTRGTIITPPDAKGEAMVQAGIMKMKIHVSQMRRCTEEPAKKKKPVSSIKLSDKPVSMECDVRGLSLEEALQEVDRYIDACMLQSLKNVQIIHGKGTGVLRNGIGQHLKKHPAVKEYRLGRYGEGEDGVTVVTLK